MKTFQLKSSASFSATKLACTGLLVFTLGFAGGASAQPKMGGRNDGPGGGGDRTARMTQRIYAGIEEKTGKKLTPAQKSKLSVAIKAHAASTKAANEKLAKQISTITGIKVDDMRGFGRGGGMRGQR